MLIGVENEKDPAVLLLLVENGKNMKEFFFNLFQAPKIIAWITTFQLKKSKSSGAISGLSTASFVAACSFQPEVLEIAVHITVMKNQ